MEFPRTKVRMMKPLSSMCMAVGGVIHDPSILERVEFGTCSPEYDSPATFRGSSPFLTRSAHGSDIHPLHPMSILVMGGYGGVASTYVWMNDIFVIDTERCVHTYLV